MYVQVLRDVAFPGVDDQGGVARQDEFDTGHAGVLAPGDGVVCGGHGHRGVAAVESVPVGTDGADRAFLADGRLQAVGHLEADGQVEGGSADTDILNGGHQSGAQGVVFGNAGNEAGHSQQCCQSEGNPCFFHLLSLVF